MAPYGHVATVPLAVGRKIRDQGCKVPYLDELPDDFSIH